MDSADGMSDFSVAFSDSDEGQQGGDHPVTLQSPSLTYQVTLAEKVELSPNTRLFRFNLPTPDHKLGLTTGKNIYLSAAMNGEEIVRPYTPVSCDDDFGLVDLVIKVYFKNVNPNFPEGGKMSQYLNDLQIGTSINIRGPAGRLTYKGKGQFSIDNGDDQPQTLNATKINMIAGGSGITPMLQVIRHILRDSGDDSSMVLLFANQSEDDILCREDLEQIQAQRPERFKLWYTVDRSPDGWKYSSGFINADMIKDHLFPPSQDTVTLICGPPPMINEACKPALSQFGYEEERTFIY